jgi:uncharacterized membrane protein (UPF0127 family)
VLETLRPDQALEVLNAAREVLVVRRLRLALGYWSRLRGLLGSSTLPPGEGLLLRPCSAIHTFFMRYPIDAVFVDRCGQVVGLRRGLRPWRASGSVGGAYATLELPAGTVARTGTQVGDILLFRPRQDRG